MFCVYLALYSGAKSSTDRKEALLIARKSAIWLPAALVWPSACYSTKEWNKGFLPNSSGLWKLCEAARRNAEVRKSVANVNNSIEAIKAHTRRGSRIGIITVHSRLLYTYISQCPLHIPALTRSFLAAITCSSREIFEHGWKALCDAYPLRQLKFCGSSGRQQCLFSD